MKIDRTVALSALLAAALAGAAAGQPALTVELKGFLEDPIVVTAPRDKIPQRAVVDPIINATLVRLLRQRSEVRPSDIGVDLTAGTVFSELTTLRGHKLRLRYNELGFMLTEGLAGAKDFELQTALDDVARAGQNPQIRAAAMVALAYTKEERFLGLFQNGMQDEDLVVRLGALEALILLDSQSARFSIADAARNDESPAVRAMAAAWDWKSGNVTGREILMGMAQDADWFTRAYAVYYLGEHGGADEYRRLMDLLQREQSPIVKTELVRSLMKLEKVK